KRDPKFQKTQPKRLLGMITLCVLCDQSSMRNRTAHIEFEFSLHTVTVLHGPCMSKCPIGVLAVFFGTLDPDFSGPKWPFLSVLFAKHSKMTPSFKIMQSWRGLELHASHLLL